MSAAAVIVAMAGLTMAVVAVLAVAMRAFFVLMHRPEDWGSE